MDYYPDSCGEACDELGPCKWQNTPVATKQTLSARAGDLRLDWRLNFAGEKDSGAERTCSCSDSGHNRLLSVRDVELRGCCTRTSSKPVFAHAHTPGSLLPFLLASGLCQLAGMLPPLLLSSLLNPRTRLS